VSHLPTITCWIWNHWTGEKAELISNRNKVKLFQVKWVMKIWRVTNISCWLVCSGGFL